MSKSIQPEPASNYVAPRNKPLKYPGPRPERGFILSNGLIHPILYDAQEMGASRSTYAGRAITDSDGNYQRINDFLESRKVAPLGERYAVLGFGSNPVPGQLVSKFGDYAVVPTIFGGMADSDVVYNLISGQGYAFAELALNQPGVKGNVAITFLDEEQLKIMNESEENYDLALLSKTLTLESGEDIRCGDTGSVLFYAGRRKIWVPEGFDSPVAIAELPSEGRTAKALDQTGTLDLVIADFDLSNRYGIGGAQNLADYIRAGTSDSSNLLSYLREGVANNEKSLDPVNSGLTILSKEATPSKVFEDTYR